MRCDVYYTETSILLLKIKDNHPCLEGYHKPIWRQISKTHDSSVRQTWMLLGLRGGFATHWRGTWYLSSVEFTHSVMSDSLRLYELQQARPPCASPTPGVHPNSCALNRWCHPAISSSVIPFSSCLQTLPASESFPMSQLFAWGGQNTGVATLASVLPKNTQDWSPLEWTG